MSIYTGSGRSSPPARKVRGRLTAFCVLLSSVQRLILHCYELSQPPYTSPQQQYQVLEEIK
uniref:Uncharacterized protein n=1 Tax=Anguilla anguilla TaxID=7936 RepID=A0A0E9V8P5_ANGAN